MRSSCLTSIFAVNKINNTNLTKMSRTPNGREFTLYSWSASDCSARLRIALALKHIPYSLINIDLAKGERSESSVNPNRTVPTLVISSPTHDSRENVQLTQSVAALEYLEEAFEGKAALLPSLEQPEARAAVRTLVQVIATDVHPLTTPRVAEYVTRLSSDSTAMESRSNPVLEWDLHWMQRGLAVYERLAITSAGTYSVGDNVTMADICLYPEVSTAKKMGLKMDDLPIIRGIIERLGKVEAFRDDPHVSARLGE